MGYLCIAATIRPALLTRRTEGRLVPIHLEAPCRSTIECIKG